MCALYRVLFVLVFLNGCSYTSAPLEFKGEAVEYAEILFKRQNQATFSVMMMLEDELALDVEDKLSIAELHMHEECRLLNEMAMHEKRREKVSLYFKTQVQQSFGTCEESVRQLELILKHED